MQEDLLQVRSFGVNFYVLRDSRGLYLLDGGFVGGPLLLRRALKRRGWQREPLLGIIVTHGHLDHTLNIGRLAEESGAWIAAPGLDRDHYQGKASYRGWGKVTGLLESAGSPIFDFRPFTPTRILGPGDELDVWRGLTVFALPGHTPGHSGFYCESLKLLFCADLFASYGKFSHLPPSIFNDDSRMARQSVLKALELSLKGVLPNHADRASPERHLERLRALGAALLTSNRKYS